MTDDDTPAALDHLAARLLDVEQGVASLDRSVRHLAELLVALRDAAGWRHCEACGRCLTCRQVLHEHTPEGGG